MSQERPNSDVSRFVAKDRDGYIYMYLRIVFCMNSMGIALYMTPTVPQGIEDAPGGS